MGILREVQNIEAIKKRFKAGIPIHVVIEDGYFQNTEEYPRADKYSLYKKCEYCGSKIKDEESQDLKKEMTRKYSIESNRLHTLFREALCAYHELDINDKKVQKALSLAWEKGQNDHYEVASEFEDLLVLLD